MTAEASAIRIHYGNDTHTPIVTGCPFPASADLSRGAVIRYASGRESFAQALPLTHPTPGDVRWWELSFLGTEAGDATVEPACRSTDATSALARESDARIEFDNGTVRARVSARADETPIRVSWDGGRGELVPEVITEELGPCRETPDAERHLTVLRNGPVRAQVELRGTLNGHGGSLDYRLTVEIWKDLSALRVDWMLTNRVSGRISLSVKEASLWGRWEVGESTARVFRQRNHTAYGHPRDVINPDPVVLIADETCISAHVSDPAMLLDDAAYPFYMAPPKVETDDWLELRGSSGRVSARVVDFADTRPNALVSEGDVLTYRMIPPTHPLPWSQGWRKEQHLLLAFAPTRDEPAPEALAERATAVFALGRAQPTPSALRALHCFDLHRILQYGQGHLRMEALMHGLCNLETSATKWDLGDTPDWHYTRGYAGGANQYLPLPGADEFPRTFKAGGGGFVFPEILKYFVQPAWTNNEYDMIHALATEVLRTGSDGHFRMLRWTARHNVEIDFLSFSDDPQHHRASPFHSHFHNRKGAISSHFWTQGLLQYYCLTGDRDALEVAKALGDKIGEIDSNPDTRQWKFDREIGWGLLSLCCLVEAGYEEYLPEARRIAGFLQAFDRQAFSGAVNLSAGVAGRSLERQMIDNGFGYSSMVEALARYQDLAGDETSTHWFEQLLRQLKDAFWKKIDDSERVSARSMVGLVMAIGFERTGDPAFLTAGRLVLECYLDPAFPGSGHVPVAAGTEAGQSKPSAMAYRGLHRLLGALDRAGELTRYEYPVLRERNSADQRTRKPGDGSRINHD